MKAGKFVDGVPYSWKEIYELTGCCREDFIYDKSGECTPEQQETRILV